MAHPTKTVASHVILLVETAYKLGLKLNISKCEIIADDYSVTRTMKIFDAFRKTPPQNPHYWKDQFSMGKPSMKR